MQKTINVQKTMAVITALETMYIELTAVEKAILKKVFNRRAACDKADWKEAAKAGVRMAAAIETVVAIKAALDTDSGGAKKAPMIHTEPVTA